MCAKCQHSRAAHNEDGCMQVVRRKRFCACEAFQHAAWCQLDADHDGFCEGDQ